MKAAAQDFPAQEVSVDHACNGNRIAQTLALLKRTQTLNATVVGKVEKLLLNADLSRLALVYAANLKRRNVDLGFNLFAIISDIYYRENLHSDILQALLDPNGKHQEQGTFLRLFLNLIRSQGADLDASYYSNAQVVREEGRVDVLIKGQGHVIIIENKVNNASDQPRQLPNYLNQVEKEGYACDAIVYMRLNKDAKPDMKGWTSDEIKRVEKLLICICAYTETPKDLLNGWIRKCENASKRVETALILRQYGDLITKLGGNVMNKPIMDEFYKMIVEGENFKTALCVKEMLDDLVLYRVERLIEYFKNDPSPFQQIRIYLNVDAYFTGLLWNDAHLGLDITVEPKSYKFEFWDRNDREGTKRRANEILDKMGSVNDYTRSGGSFVKMFSFPSEEQELIRHVSEFKNKLRRATESKPGT
jgi:hypothetical protein